MKCEEAQKMILLSDSGELNDGDTNKLQSHLSECAACTGYREDLSVLFKLAGTALQTAKPSPESMASIHAEIKRSKTRPAVFFRNPVFELLASAAMISIMLGGWFIFSLASQKTSRIDQLNVILDFVSEDTMLEQATYAEAARDDEKLRTLGHQLLRMQGLWEEDTPVEDLAIPDEELPATDPLSHNIHETSLKICV